MQPSPYTPGEVARLIPGRAQQLADFDERLSYLVDLGRLVGRIRVDHAPRGLGKTSLLRAYQRRAQDRGVLTVWVTAGEGALIGQIADQIGRATSTWSEGARRRVQTHLESVTVTIGLPGVAAVDATIRPGRPPTAPSGSREFEGLVRATAVGDERAGLIILIDEIQSADAEGLRTLAYAWQHLQGEGMDVPAAIYTAGLPNAADSISAAVTFSERFAYRPLSPLQPADEQFALAIPARQLGVEWDSDALEEAVAIARGYPYVVQLIGDAAWAAAGRPDTGSRIVIDHVRAGRSDMEADMDALFRARWSNATELERQFMGAMADIGEGSVRRADIARTLGVTSESLSVPRARLIDKGFIQTSSRGVLEFTIPGFSDFVRTRDRG
ncbi:AAA family ATPase [Leifsonia sp. LS-T14]|uniref:AAA family ATPase n=1 Tax=unclassified Leifsonia TaxID=2663824 RepID=UPI0035A62B1E